MLRARAALLIVALGASLARGDVVSTLSGSSLVVTGDTSGNTLTIEGTVDGLTVTGLYGTLVDGSSEVTFSGVQRLTVKMRKGSDRLTLTQLTLPGKLDVRLGKGHDSVELDDVRSGAVFIRTGDGDDAVGFFGPSSFDSVSVQTSNGRDWIWVEGAWVAGDLDIDTGADDDDVTIVATQVADDIHVHQGNDDDFLVLADVTVDDDTHLDGENGDDFLVFDGYLWFGDDLDIDGFGDNWWW
jgi:hypothetical protein